VSTKEAVVPPTATPGAARAPIRRVVTFILIYAAAAPFVFFLFFVIRGGWLAISVALMTFPSSLIWLAFNSLPQGAVLGLLVGLVPERWPWWALGSAALLLGAAMTMANSLWLGLALIDPANSAVNLAAVGLIGGVASLLVALVLCYALRDRGKPR
jgi:hypothetical protein